MHLIRITDFVYSFRTFNQHFMVAVCRSMLFKMQVIAIVASLCLILFFNPPIVECGPVPDNLMGGMGAAMGSTMIKGVGGMVG